MTGDPVRRLWTAVAVGLRRPVVAAVADRSGLTCGLRALGGPSTE